MGEIGSKEEVSAVHFVLDTLRKLIDSVLSRWPFYNTIVRDFTSTLSITHPSLLRGWSHTLVGQVPTTAITHTVLRSYLDLV